MFVRSACEQAEVEFLFQSLPFMSSKAEEKPLEIQRQVSLAGVFSAIVMEQEKKST